MSWLESTRSRSETTTRENDDQGRFLRQDLFIERDEQTNQLVRYEDAAGCYWIEAWPSREALAGHYSNPDPNAVDAAEMRGSRLRDWLRAHHPDTGVIYRPNRIDQLVMLRPQAQPTHRVTLE